MAEQPAPEDQTGKEGQGPFWTRADLKLFLLTFAGTVAANVLTVIVVAVAIIVARSTSRWPSHERPSLGSVVLALSLVLAGMFAVGMGVAVFRSLRRERDTTSRSVVAVTLTVAVMGGLTGLVCLLVLLGWAVGVK